MPDLGDAAPRRSAFAASFLSLLFPGLGQAYAGAPWRALAFATPAVLLVALVGGLLFEPSTRRHLAFSLLDTNVLLAILAADVLILAYRLVAIVDAYRLTGVLAEGRPTGGQSRRVAGRSLRAGPTLALRALSGAGLVAVLLVASGVHVAVAYYDLAAYDLIRTVTSENRAVTPQATGGELLEPLPTPTTAAPARPTPTAGESVAPSPSATPASSERVNILLIGVDRRPAERTFNTDTMIVVSIDPRTRQIAMLSLPRDTVDVPLPRSWPAHSFYGGAFPGKITTLWRYASGQPALYPFPNGKRGPEALKGALGTLYGIDIPWYVEVDFDGFRRVVDTLGGVSVRVDLPVQDDKYPQEFGRGSTRLYIPATIQHMSGDEALAYARSRHGSNDFDRAQRQQNVLIALRQQADIPTILARLPELVATLKDAVHTDIPTSKLPQLAALADEVGFDNVRSLVFTPPRFAREVLSDPRGRGYVLEPKVTAIRRAVEEAFSFDPQLEASREAVAAEGASVRVLNGSRIDGQATAVKDYLLYRGFDATVPTTNGGRAARQDYRTTAISVYNGAAERLPESIAVLEEIFGVEVAEKVDPSVTVDIVVITGTDTPKLVVPQG